MSIIERLLQPPTYGYERDGKLYVPSRKEIWSEFFGNLNPARRHNWLSLVGVGVNLVLVGVLALFFAFYFSWPLFGVVFLYGFFVLGSFANFWIHRYCTHKAFQFRNPFLRMVCRNLAVKVVVEETHVVSHHVHHALPDKPGDPHNSKAGWLYCFLADVNHQAVRKDLNEEEYLQVCRLMGGIGIRQNSYEQYRKWGSVCHPLFTIGHYVLNWSVWFFILSFLGGLPLVTAVFGAAGLWALLYRNFNYASHGAGKDLRQKGIDFNWKDLSVNNTWTGIVSGEWHNNHHLYPTSARSGFQSYQIDLPWYFIKLLHAAGVITSYRDCKDLFDRKILKTAEPSEGRQSPAVSKKKKARTVLRKRFSKRG